jgi:hypothetical protein
MYKQPKVFKEHTNKQLTEIRIQTNSWVKNPIEVLEMLNFSNKNPSLK